MVLDDVSGAMLAMRIQVAPVSEEQQAEPPPDMQWLAVTGLLSGIFGFAIIGTCVAGLIAAADALVSRNLLRGLLCGACGVGIAAAGGLVALLPGSMVFGLTLTVVGELAGETWSGDTLRGLPMLVLVVGRSLTWGILGLTVGLGQGVALKSRRLILNGLLGGMLGGLVGGTLFDPIEQLFAAASESGQALVSRGIGFTVIGLSAGLMIGLVERVAKDSWLQMLAGPLAGKEFVIFKSPMSIGSSPKCDVYLFKDAEVEPRHALIQEAGGQHEIVDLDARSGVVVNGRRVGRHRLMPGDQIMIGSTVLEYAQRERSFE
jgi:hypothetical protein